MKFEKIILVTESPKGIGIAHYYYLALKDILPPSQVSLIDEDSRESYDKVGFTGKVIRRIKYMAGWHSKDTLKRIEKECRPGAMNVLIIFNTARLQHAEIQALSDKPFVYLIHLMSDSPFGMHKSYKSISLSTLPVFDMVCVFAKPLIPVLYQLGAKYIVRIPFAYCRYTHFIADEIIKPEYPQSVYYFGTWTPTIEEWVKPLKEFDLHIEGFFWDKASDEDLKKIGTKDNPHAFRGMAEMARKAGVVVNFTRANHGCYHTMKTFELTIAGACVVSNYSDEQDEFFPSERSMVYFNTAEEMVTAVRSLLANKDMNLQIRENALQAALPHNYHARSAYLVEMINKELEKRKS